MAGEPDGTRARRSQRRQKRKSKNSKRSNLSYNLRWALSGFAVGLPLLAIAIYAISR